MRAPFRSRAASPWMLAWGLGLASFVACPSRVAHAQSPSSDAAATALFDEGLKLMARHDYAAACPKLAESQRLGPSGGTLFNLADCYEHVGKTASAWAAWKDVAARANAAGKTDVERRALAHAAALEPNLARLTLTIDPASDVPGLQVTRDGVAVGHAEFGTPIPVDPGDHAVEASAPSKQALSSHVTVAAKQADATLRIVLLDAPPVAPPPTAPAVAPPPSPAAAAPGPTEPPSTSSWNTNKTLAVVAGGVGVAGVVVGSVFGLVAKSKNDQALQPQNCATSTLCTPTGLSLTSDAKSAADLSTVAFVVGGVGLAAGVVLWLTAPSPTTTGMRLVPTFTGSFGGLQLDAGF